MTPTDAQIAAIGKLADKVQANKKQYIEDSASIGIAILYKKDSPADQSLTVVTNTIYGYNKDGRPLTMMTNYRVEPDGITIDMDEDFTRSEQAAYIATLTKLQMNQ